MLQALPAGECFDCVPAACRTSTCGSALALEGGCDLGRPGLGVPPWCAHKQLGDRAALDGGELPGELQGVGFV